MSRTGISSNKAWCSPLICCFILLGSLTPAGRGGEGRENGDGRSGGCREEWRFSALMRWRSVKQSPTLGFAGRPRWRAADYPLKVSLLLNKRCRLLLRVLAAPFLLLAGLGGEGVEDDAAVDAMEWRRRLGSAERAASAAVSKRRCFAAAAISGHKGGPAALEPGAGSSFFFLLHWRIFSDLGVVVCAGVSPSGLVPGGGMGDRVWRSSIGDEQDEERGLDRVFFLFCGVLCVKLKDLDVFFLFSRVLFVFVSSPPI
jgi:hypothetical protein